MVSLVKTLAAIPDGGGRLVYGTAYYDGAQWWANVGGNNLGARWLDPIVPAQGDKIVVLLSSDGAGQSNAIVLGGYTDQPRPSTGSVLTVGATELVVTGSFGGTFTTTRFINPYIPGAFLEGPVPLGQYRLQEPPRVTYAPGDPVHLAWDAAIPTVLGIIGVPVSAPIPAPKPDGGNEAPASSTKKAAATRSNTYAGPAYGWGNYAGSQQGGQQLYSGTWYGATTSGAWFYGDAFTGLAGRTVTAIRFWIPKRLNVGVNGPATIHLYAHTSKKQPGGDVYRVPGSANFTLGQEQSGRWVDLPLSFAPHLSAGGGIAIAGEPYVGLTGRLKDPQSGRIEMDSTP